MQITTKLYSTVFAAVAAMVAFGAPTTKPVTSNMTITLTTATTGNRGTDSSDSNPNAGGGEGYNLVCSDGVTISFAPAAASGLNRFYSTVTCGVGKVTLDFSNLNGAPFLMLGNLHFGSAATLHIKGTNTVYFGSDLNWPSYYPTFNVPHAVEFDEGVDGKIVFQDQCCLYAKPAGMTYEITPGANVAIHNNALGVFGDYTMTDFDISIFDSTDSGSKTSFPANTTITVPTGRTLNIFPCSINSSLRWNRHGGTIANNVHLAGGTLAVHVNQYSSTLAGALSGTGTIRSGWTFGDWTQANNIVVSGPVALTNAVVDLLGRNSSSAQGMNLSLSKVQPGSSFASISMHKTSASVAGEISLLGLGKDISADYAGKPIVITSLVGGRLSNGILNSFVPLSITSASGGMKVSNNNGTDVVFGAIDAEADVAVQQPGSATLPAGWSSYWESDGYAHLFLLKDGDTFDAGAKSPVAGADIVATNAISVTGANSMFRITAAQGGDVTLYQSSGARMQVIADGGRINLRRAFADWRAIPTLWLDASAANTISNLYIKAGTIDQTTPSTTLAAQYVYYTNNFPLVNLWYDCREEMRSYKAWSDRYDQLYKPSGSSVSYNALFPHTHPYRVTGGLNGKDYISFGKYGVRQEVSVQTSGGETITSGANDMCRMYFYNNGTTTANGRTDCTLKPKFAFLVFGSQQGGGDGLFAGQNTNFLKRANTNLNAALAPNADIDIWVDGESVTPTQTGVLNGGWQVISLGLAGKVRISAIGSGMIGGSTTTYGGQNYAEIIFVDQSLTDMQRQTIEMALAEKWGLAGQYNYPAWATEAVSAVYGSSGTVHLETDARLTGAFAGTIELNGRKLEIAGDSLPPDASAISTGNMVGWYDPDNAGMRMETNSKFSATRKSDNVQVTLDKDPALRLSTVWNLLNDSFVVGDYALFAQADRRPYLDDSPRGIGPVRKWMNFANLTQPSSSEYKSFSIGNSMKFARITNAANGGTDNSAYQQPMRTIMMAQDSVRGGGSPFMDGANIASPVLYKRAPAADGNPALPGKPIYPSGTDAILTAGKTYLDGYEVDGTVKSFAGRPEVLTVIPTGTFNVISIGNLSNSEKSSVADGNTTAEIIGEIMMWDCALDDTSRKTAEAYLSWKWLGTTTEGYSALTNATVTGEGSVKAANAAVLPKFAANCTADVTLANGDMTFTLDGDALSGALDLGDATLKLPAACTVTVELPRKPVLGEYTLLSCGGIAEGTTFTFATTGYGIAKTQFVATENGIVLRVLPRGMVIGFK